MSAPLLPLFVKLAGRDVVVVGGGAMALLRVRQLAGAGARVTVVAPEVRGEIARTAAVVRRRAFEAADLDGAWLAIAAATPAVNRAVGAAAEARRILVNAVDDPEAATAYTAGVVRRGGATVAVSTGGRAPALAGLLREAIDAVLPRDLGAWVDAAEAERPAWKRARVPLATRRPLLLRRLNALYDGAPAAGGDGPVPPGTVSLVGAGPGDPGLLTRRGAERLAAADVVLYDALVDAEVLRLAPRAHCFYVGKRAGRPSVSQRAIERLLVRAARRGQRVVRLKCGDPFVLGRGGEEALALAAAGVPFEIVPGVSSAIAAPALAGIPVTHRGTAAAFAVVSGHREATYGPILDGLAPGTATLVVLMGVSERARIAARLQARGWDPATPAAVVLGASSAAASTWRGTLAELAAAPLPADRDLPGTLVVGAAAALSLVPGGCSARAELRGASPRSPGTPECSGFASARRQAEPASSAARPDSAVA
ncbi:MAG TPA: uroporphyrinogen-III C-methyltransferase [Anaeromyxobacter sp.]|nr:uroporphyrinogen-III C-methyltransferase [Anaeromyxobacter sp.]